MNSPAHTKLRPQSSGAGILFSLLVVLGCDQTQPDSPCPEKLQNEAALCFKQVPGPLVSPFSFLRTSDLYLDGSADLIVASFDPFVRIFSFEKDGTFTLKQTLEIDATVFNIEIGDFNSDQFKDILILGADQVLHLFQNTTQGTLQEISQITSSQHIEQIKAADINNDSFDDIITYGNGGRVLTILTNNTNGVFNISNTFETNSAFLPNIKSGDINSDSNIDIITHSDSFLQQDGLDLIYIFENQGNGTFNQKEINLDFQATSTEIIDVDGNQTKEIIASSGSRIFIFENHGTPKIPLQFQKQDEFFFQNSLLPSLGVKDLNKDGLPDIFGLSLFGTTLLLNQNGETFVESSSLRFEEPIDDIDVDDLNGDQFPDVVVAGIQRDSISLFIQVP